MKSKIVTYDSDFYHNGHGQQRDRLLIELYGEEWLKEQKSKGFYAGDWADEVVGTKKDGLSGYIDENGQLSVATDVVRLRSLEDLDKINHNK